MCEFFNESAEKYISIGSPGNFEKLTGCCFAFVDDIKHN